MYLLFNTCSPNLALKTCRVLTELWSSGVSVGSLKKQVLILAEECSCGSNGIDELASKCEGKYAKTFPSFMSFYLDCHHKVPPIFRVGLPASNSLIQKIPSKNVQKLVF